MADHPLGRSAGQEQERHPIVAGSRQPIRKRHEAGSKEPIRQLHENARAVPRVLIATAGAAMLKVLEDLEPTLDGRVTWQAAQVGYEPDPARVPLEGRVVKSLLGIGRKRTPGRLMQVRHEAVA